MTFKRELFAVQLVSLDIDHLQLQEPTGLNSRVPAGEHVRD